jgi:hypothetical protein
MDRLQEFITRRWGTSIVPTGDDLRRTAPVDGWYDGNKIYLPTTVAQEATGNTLPAKALSKALRDAGWIDDEPEGKVSGDRPRNAAARRPGGGGWYRAAGMPRCRVYELIRDRVWPKGITPGEQDTGSAAEEVA